ncbi:MAG: DUF2905 domain-containing protein [Elusimicrobiota bacterium]|nr:DUF2905 domain-containing protein [Endomicrobiia bacterium]MCX7910897.1 DUF2905 domain-containing protein [Endomicrobiia bacterium]MDW8165420.1 DUF2905 domain-containing protein [Elusimicrobiota bacterium]
MNEIGKFLIFVGATIILVGVLLLTLEKIPYIGKLPGDILIKKKNFVFYFPLATSIILSILLTLIINLFIRRR